MHFAPKACTLKHQVARGELFLRERPGSHNALGRVKFLFPNDHAIYLHDTPNDKPFEEAQRDFSHGCIRVERPAELAKFVLGPQGWDDKHIAEALENSVDESVAVDHQVNVHFIYMTAFPAWKNDERQIEFYPDLYYRDPALIV